MKREFPNGPIICLAAVLLVIGIVIHNQRNHSYEKAVERMHQEVNHGDAIEVSPSTNLVEYREYGRLVRWITYDGVEHRAEPKPQSWGGSPTNSPVCAAPTE